MLRHLRISTFAAVVVFGGVADARQLPPDAVFVEVDARAIVDPLPAMDASVRDRQVVGMRLDRIFSADGPAASFRLNLRDHAWIAVHERDDRDPSGFRSWVGVIEGIDNSHVVVTERAGMVSGLINAVSATYQIRTAGPGIYLVERFDARSYRQDDALLPELNEPGVPDNGAPRLPPAAGEAPDGIDVLMVYTPAARERFGVAQVQAIAAQVVSDTNTAFVRSGVVARFRSVGVVEIPLIENPSMNVDLRALTNDLGPRLRGQYRADLVQLIEVSRDQAYCGIAWILTTPNATDFSAFSVSDIGRAGCIGQYTSAHEFGHNLGSDHDPAYRSGGRLYPYSYGYQDPGRGFRTVMAYPCYSSGWCPAIPNFSNPGVVHAGGATGTTDQNNALSINNIALAASNWRQTTAPGPPDPPISLQAINGGDRMVLSWTPPATGGIATGFVLEVGTQSGGSELYQGPVGGLPTVSGVVPPGTYYWRVVAVNAFGSSAASAEAQFTITAPAPPTAPTSLFSQVIGNSVTLTWGGATGNPAPSNYILQIGSATGLSNIFSGAVGNVTSVTGSAPNGTYFWRVIAANAFGNSLPSSERQFTAGCTDPPGAVLSLAATRSGQTVTLSWLPPLTGGAPTQYVIEAGSASGLSNLLVFPTGSTSTFLSTQAPSGTYYVRVLGQNTCGTGPASNEQVIVVP